MVRLKLLKITLLFLLSIILVSNVFAITPFFDSWKYAGDTFTEEGSLYAVGEGSDAFQMSLSKEGEFYIINIDKCQENADRTEKYCFVDTGYPDDDNHIKYEAGDIYYGVHLQFYNLIPQLDLDHKAEATSLKIGDTTRLTVTMTNKGEKAISEAILKIPIPEAFDIYGLPIDATFKDGVLTKKFNLGPEKTMSYTYQLKVLDYASEKIVPEVTYSYNGNEQHFEDDSVTLNVPSPYLITQKLSKNKVGINEESTYSFSFENNDGTSDINLKISLDGLEGLKVKYPNKFKDGVYEVTLAPGEKLNEKLILSAEKSTTNIIKIKFEFTIGDGELITKNYQSTLSAILPNAVPRLSLKDSYQEESPILLRAFLKNPSNYNHIYEIQGYIINEETKESYPFKKTSIAKDSEELIFEKEILAPKVDAEKKITYTLKGSYESVNGEGFSFETSKDVKIINKKEPYTITRTLNDSSLEAGDLVEVTLKVKNNLEEYAPLVITDILPDTVFIKAGFRSLEKSLDEGQEEEIYIYKMQLAETYAADNLKILTKIYNKNTGETFEQEDEYEVKPYEPIIKQQDNDNQEEVKGEDFEVPEKKKGFFTKIVDGISNFFSNLFN